MSEINGNDTERVKVFHDFKIRRDGLGGGHIWIDGIEQHGITELNIYMDAVDLPVVTVKYLLGKIDMDSKEVICQKRETYGSEVLDKPLSELHGVSTMAYNAVAMRLGGARQFTRAWRGEKRPVIGDLVELYKSGTLKSVRRLGKKGYAEIVAELKRIGALECVEKNDK